MLDIVSNRMEDGDQGSHWNEGIHRPERNLSIASLEEMAAMLKKGFQDL